MQQPSDSLHQIRHTAEHVLTQAMYKLYGDKNITMAMGPATDDGFYFDFDSPKDFSISEDNFKEIEKEMQKIINRNLPVTRQEISITEAKKLFKNNPYKQEWLEEIKSKKEPISVYWTADEFVDLCAGPHAKSTGEIKAFKLLSIAGAYWHGDEKNKMLTRIYGTAFESKAELTDHLHRLEEAKKRDHRKLGPALELFIISDDIGKGLPLLTPKGTIIRNQIIALERELESKAGFEEVWTPHIAKNNLYKRTGHWDHYQDVMYAPFGIDEETYVLKPMNCPHHYMIYESKPRSYRDLPIRLCEPGTCYRYEKSGELGGLTRVRALTIDDSHILMTENQVDAEFGVCINMVKKMFEAFGINDYYVRLSLNDPNDQVKYIADPKTWKKAGEKLEAIVKENKLEYVLGTGEASFYGPKIDFIVKDAIGREWQMSTLQLDLFMAKKLGLTYTDFDGQEKNPVILHRGLTGSLERTMGLLIEHFAGAFPLWLSPIQTVIIPIGENHVVAAKLINERLKEAGIRSELWDQAESMQKRIRNAEKQKVPYMLIIGDKEAESDSVAVRVRGQEDRGIQKTAQFLKHIQGLITTKSLTL
jgi:threonyl-tRNA synthetase